MSLSITPTGAALGAEIAGVDLTQPLDDATSAKIRDAFYRYEVAFFRGRELSDDDHIRFSARFGELRKVKVAHRLDLRPEILVVSNIKENGKYIGGYDVGNYWHTDGDTYANPHALSLLRALEVPEQDGRVLGDTLFNSVSAAYDALPTTMKKRLEGLEALQRVNGPDENTVQASQISKGRKALDGVLKDGKEAIHPVVRVHPVTGRKCLYVNEGHTVGILGMPEDESKALIAELLAHCIKPEFQYRHRWRTHDLLLWDDCSTQHKATFDYPAHLRRLMHRTTVYNLAAA